MVRFEKCRYKNTLSTGNVFTEILLNRSKTTLIIGKNGSGKSTLLDALSFALYGRPFRDIKVGLLVNSMTNKHQVVEVEFNADGKDYKIIRGQRPKRFEIYRNGQLVNQDDRNTDYQKWLETEVLRMNFKSFKQIVILGSAGYTPFMELKSDHRRVVSEDLLDIHVFSHMYSLLKKEIDLTNDYLRDVITNIDNNKRAIAIHREHVSAKKEDYEAIEADLNDRIDRALATITEIETDLQQLYDQQGKLATQIADRSKVASTLAQLTTIERQIEDRMMNYRKEIEFFSNNEHCPTCSQEIDEAFKSETVCSHNVQISTLETGITEVEQKKNELSTRFEQIEYIGTQLTQIASDIRNGQTRIDFIRGQIADYQAQLDRHIETHDHKKAEATISMLSRVVVNDLEVRKQLLEQKEVQEYANILLKDNGIKARVIKKYIPVINKLINSYLAKMGFYITFELDEHFNETIKTANKQTYTYNSFSEGEKMRVNLAILFAWRDVAKIRNSMSTNLLIMDETFDSSLDEAGVEELVKILEHIAGDTNIFVISHKSTMFDKFRSLIKFEKSKNFSKIVQDGAS